MVVLAQYKNVGLQGGIVNTHGLVQNAVKTHVGICRRRLSVREHR